MRTLSEVLCDIDRLGLRAALYLPEGRIWAGETACAVLDPGEAAGPDAVPAFARENGLSYVLGVAQVQDVVANAREQKADADAADLLRAFLFYCDRDAFIDFAAGQ